MTVPLNLPANWGPGQSFGSAAENNVEAAVNWMLGQFRSGISPSSQAISTPQATSGTGQTQISSYSIPANTLTAGSSYRVQVFGTQTANAATLTCQIHLGTTNTTSDAVVTSVAPSVGSSGSACFDGLLTIQNGGATGTAIAEALGIGSSTAVSTTTSPSNFNSTVANYLTVSVAASAGTFTAQNAIISQMNVSAMPQPSGPSGTFNLKFEENFAGTTLNTNNWSPTWFNGGSQNGVTTSAANVTVNNGLTLTLSSSTVGASINTWSADAALTGYTYTNGVVEARCFFPDNGTNLYNWPAFWTDGTGTWPITAEIDIAEVLSPGQMTGHYIWGAVANTPTVNQQLYNAGDLSGWHTYTVQRTSGQLQLWVDGVLKATQITSDGSAAHFIILNIGVGQGPTLTGSSGAFKVQYVRSWS